MMKKGELEGWLGLSVLGNLVGGGLAVGQAAQNKNLEHALHETERERQEAISVRDEALFAVERALDQRDTERDRADRNAELAQKNFQQANANAEAAIQWKRLYQEAVIAKRRKARNECRLWRLLRKSRKQTFRARSKNIGGASADRV